MRALPRSAAQRRGAAGAFPSARKRSSSASTRILPGLREGMRRDREVSVRPRWCRRPARRESNVEPGFREGWIQRHSLQEGILGFRADDAVLRGNQRLAKIGKTLCRFARNCDDPAIRKGRILESAKAHIGRSDHLEAACIVRVAGQVKFNALQRLRHLGVTAGRYATRDRLVRKVGRTHAEVERNGEKRQADQQRECCHFAAAGTACPLFALALLLTSDGQQTPRLFSLGGRALALGNQASCNLPLQLQPPRLIELHRVIEA